MIDLKIYELYLPFARYAESVDFDVTSGVTSE